MWIPVVFIILILWAIGRAHEEQENKTQELEDRIDELEGKSDSRTSFDDDVDDAEYFPELPDDTDQNTP